MIEKLKLFYYNIRLCFSYNIFMTGLFFISSIIFYNLKNMELMDYLKMGELYLPLSGMFLFVYIGGLEENIGCWEIVCSKRKKFVFLHLFRIFILAVILMLMFLALLSFIWINSQYIGAWSCFWGIYIDALFIGVIGMFFADLTGSYAVGYIVDMGCYGIGTIFGNDGFFGCFQLTGYLDKNITSKYVLLGMTLLIILVDSVYYCSRQKLK